MNCPKCGVENSESRKFCRACGAGLAPLCPRCGTGNDAGDRFCGECGAALDPATTAQSLAGGSNTNQITSDERRPVTILFADIAGFTALSEQMDAEEVRDLTTECFRRLVSRATSLGGTVDKFIGDAVMLLFGAPTAHEDDPVRAVRAALAIQDALEVFNSEVAAKRGLKLGLRIGIETGEVVAGTRDVNGVLEYTVIGDAVNVASRLQSATEIGTILVGPNTARLVRHAAQLHPNAPLRLKGKSAPLEAWTVIASTSAGSQKVLSDHGPFVGREPELRHLQQCLDELRRGRGQVTCVIGDPGMGKSRLLAELRREASDLHWWQCAANAHEEATSYGLTRNILSQLCCPMPASDGDIAKQIIQHLERLGCTTGLPAVARAIGLPWSALSPRGEPVLTPRETQQVILETVQRVLEHLVTTGPAVLVLEDLHWSDPTSIELLSDLLPLTEQLPILFCLAFRPDRDAASWQLRDHAARTLPHRFAEISLQPLTNESASELAGHLLGTSILPVTLQALLYRAAGTPLWLEELIRMLRERAVPEQSATSFESVSTPEIPESLQALIIARIDRLGEARLTLQIASVIGREFSQRVLARVSEAGAIDSHLSQAQRADIIRELSVLPERAFGFKHVLMQEAAYSTLLHRRRRELHGRVADALQELEPERLEALRPTLAFHYSQASAWEQAREHATAAAEQARSGFANREALIHYTHALNAGEKLGKHGGDQLQLLERRAEVHTDLGQFDAARRDYETARAEAAAIADLVSEARIVGALAALWSGHQNYEEGLRLAHEAVSIAERAGAPRELASAHIRVATGLLNLNRESNGLESLESALEIAQSIGDARGEAQTLDLLGMASLIFGDADRGIAYAERAIPRLRAVNDRWTEASSTVVLGECLAFRGSLPEGLQWIRQALQIWTEVDSASGIAYAHGCLAQISEPFGRLQFAFDEANTGLELARQIGHREWSALGLWMLGRVHRTAGDPRRAIKLHREMHQVASQVHSVLWRSVASAELGYDHLELAELDVAEEHLLQSLPMGSGRDLATVQAKVAMADLLLRRGKHRDALDHAAQVWRAATGFLPVTLNARVTQARAAAALGSASDAIAILRDVIQRSQQHDIWPPRWRAHLALSELHDHQGRRAEARAEAASALSLLSSVRDELTHPDLRASFEQSSAMSKARERAV
ncbi:MAG: AAA family ATPase [Chloroflexota bacterium]